MSTKNARNLGLRLDEIDTNRLAKLEAETGLEGVSVARNALRAALTFYENEGYISFPMKVIPVAAAGGGRQKRAS